MTRHATLTMAFAVLVTSGVECQDRRGFWIGFGAGPAWTFDDPHEGHSNKWPAVFLRAGGTINSRVRLGGEFCGVTDSGLARTNLVAGAQYFPFPGLGSYLKVGAGAAYLDVREENADHTWTVNGERTLGLTVGVGWEIHVVGPSIGLGVDGMYQAKGGVRDLSGESRSHWVLALTLGVVFP